MSNHDLRGGSVRILWDADDTAQVNITRADGSPATFTVAGSTATFPYTLSASTTFETNSSGDYLVSVEHHGIEVADTPDGVRAVHLSGDQQHIFAPTPDATPSGKVTAALFASLDPLVGGRVAEERRNYLRQIGSVVEAGAVVDRFNGKTTWTMTSGTGSVTTAGRELTITTTGAATVTAKRVVALDLTDRFLSFEIYRDANLETFDVKLATGTDADTNGWRVNEAVTKIPTGMWYRYTLPLSQAVVLGSAVADDVDDVQAIRFVVNPLASVDTTVKIRNLRTHPLALPPSVHFQFDDGRADTYSVAYPILRASGYTGGIAVEYNQVGNANRCSLAQLREMYDAGWSIYGHHTVQATDLSDSQVEAIFQASQAFNDENGFERGKAHWVWPGGASDSAKEAVGRRYWRSMRKVNGHHWFAGPHVFEPVDPAHIYIQTNTSLATAKSRLDAVAQRGGAAVLVFHTLQDPKVAQEDWTPSDFEALVEYARELGLADTNLDQLYGAERP